MNKHSSLVPDEVSESVFWGHFPRTVGPWKQSSQGDALLLLVTDF